MLTQPGRMYQGGAGVLKITDFGTSCFCEGDTNAQKTAGTPTFFSPELCTTDTAGTYDVRIVDLWAMGVTLYMWISGRVPFEAPTTLLLMQMIAAAPPKVWDLSPLISSIALSSLRHSGTNAANDTTMAQWHYLALANTARTNIAHANTACTNAAHCACDRSTRHQRRQRVSGRSSRAY